MFYAALKRAFLIEHPGDRAKCKNVLTTLWGMSDDEAESKLLFDSAWTLRRVRRHAPDPAAMHARVQAVYFLFRDRRDPATKKPLFTAAARKIFDNLLAQIEGGYYSDPIGPDGKPMQLYYPVLNKGGRQKRDRDGLPLWRCARGTPLVECAHQKMIVCVSCKWNLGMELAECLHVEWRHRYNLSCSRKYRPGFADVKHPGTV